MSASISTVVWRSVIVLLALAGSIQFTIELISAPRVLTPGMRAEQLFIGGFVRRRGPTEFEIYSLPPNSPLIDVGVAPGDRVRYDHPLGRWHNLVAGDEVSLTISRGDESRRITVKVPAAQDASPYRTATYVISAITVFLALLLGIVIGWRWPGSVNLRALAITALMAPLAYPFSAPAAMHLPWLDFVSSISTAVAIGIVVFFAINYPDDRPRGLMAKVARIYPWMFGILVVMAVVYMARLYAGYFEPIPYLVFRTFDAIEPILFYLALLLGWRQAQGETRARFLWMLATIGVIVGFSVAGNINNWLRRPIPAETLDVVATIAILLAECGFVYAIFRHRILNFGFVVNRSLVYGVASAILLLAFFVLEKLSEHYLHVQGRTQNALIDGGIALGVFLFFHRVRHAVEHTMEKWLFRKWHDNEVALRRFVRQAEHITASGPLLSALTAEIDRFSSAGGNATYRRNADGAYALVASSLATAPDVVDPNDPLVVALRTDLRTVRNEDTGSRLPGVMALPMGHRGVLDGFVLVAAKRNSEIYRPDEIELMAFAVSQVGLDLHALEAEAFRREAMMLRASNEEMRGLVEMALAAGAVKPVQGAVDGPGA